MKTARRIFLGVFAAGWLGLSGCTAPAPSTVERAAVAALAPTGVLRVGVYPGSPTSLVRDAKTGAVAGVAHDLGTALAQKMGVPVRIVEFNRIAEVIAALKVGQVDFTFTNATAARARDVDFTPPLVQLELGLLVPPPSTISSLADADKPGLRIGVSEGGSSHAVLPQQLKNAAVVPVASLKLAQQMLRDQTLDAFATNKGILFEMADGLPGYRVLPGRWGAENLAMAVPQGRAAGMDYLQQFSQEVVRSGALQAMVARSGLRGIAMAD